MKISRRKTRAPYEFDEEYRGTRWRNGKTVSRASKGLILFGYGGRYECQLHRGYAIRKHRKVLSFDCSRADRCSFVPWFCRMLFWGDDLRFLGDFSEEGG